MKEFVYQKTTKSELLVNKDLVVETEVLEEGSRDLYDIIKFCCAVKENPSSPNLKEWSRKRHDSNLDALVYENSASVTPNHDEETAKVLSYAQRAQIYAMTGITALNAGDAEKAVWNAVRAQKYVSHIQEMIQISSPGIDRLNKKKEGTMIKSVGKDDVTANDLIDEFEKLIQILLASFAKSCNKILDGSSLTVPLPEV